MTPEQRKAIHDLSGAFSLLSAYVEMTTKLVLPDATARVTQGGFEYAPFTPAHVRALQLLEDQRKAAFERFNHALDALHDSARDEAAP